LLLLAISIVMSSSMRANGDAPKSAGCLDRYADVTYSKDIVEDPQGPATGALRATRGGTWGTPAWMCKSGVTFGAEADDRSVGLGVRIVVPVESVR